MVVSLLTGALTSCDNKQADKSTEQYHINFSEKTTIQKENKYALIVSGSPRKSSNTDLLCDTFTRGAERRTDGWRKSFSPTIVSAISPKQTSNVWAIVLASPVYYMNITGQLKTFNMIFRTRLLSRSALTHRPTGRKRSPKAWSLSPVPYIYKDSEQPEEIRAEWRTGYERLILSDRLLEMLLKTLKLAVVSNTIASLFRIYLYFYIQGVKRI